MPEKMAEPDFTIGDIWRDIAERYGIETTEDIDEFVITTAEFANMFGISQYKADLICKDEVSLGRARVTKKTVMCFGGLRTTTVQAYDFSIQKEKIDG